MSKKKQAWSYSALDVYLTCPRKYWAEKIAKVVPFVPNQATEYGKEVHKKFEEYLIKGKELPLDLKHHEKVLKRLKDAPGTGMPEQKLALNFNFEPTGFFDGDVFVRAILDYVKTNGSHALIVDHKTGKMFDGFDQLELAAACLSPYLPEIETFTLAYYWTKTKQITTKRMTKEELPEVWNNFLPKVERLQVSVNEDNFPTRPNGLCKKWCGYKDCPHSGE
jgi:hypothetical protein